MPSKKCICQEMKDANPWTAITFSCPKHGKVTIDQRLLPAPISSAPIYPIYSQPYTSGPLPAGPIWIGTPMIDDAACGSVSVGSTYGLTGQEQITLTN